MSELLTCDTCTETADGVQPAIEHVTDNPGHKMTAAIDDEGTTVTVSIDDGLDDEDDWDDDDWNAADQ